MDDTKEIMIESKNGFVVVDEMQIVSIKTKERKTTVLLSSGRRIECIRSLKEWKEILNKEHPETRGKKLFEREGSLYTYEDFLRLSVKETPSPYEDEEYWKSLDLFR